MSVVFLIILAAVLVGVALDIRERIIARRAGMRRTRPVCAACFYHLGGWTSSVCPECGADVRTVGVRTGPRSSRIVIGAGVILASVIFVGPIAAFAFTYVFAEREEKAHTRLESAAIGRLSVTFTTDGHWRRFPPRDEHDSMVVLTQLVPDVGGGAWTNGRYTGRQLGGERVLAYDKGTGVPTRPQIEAAIREVVAGDVDDAAIVKLAASIERLVATLRDGQSRGQSFGQAFQYLTDDSFKAAGNQSGHSISGGGLLSGVATLLAIIASIVFGIRAAFQRCRPGWRTPHEDEWTSLEAAG